MAWSSQNGLIVPERVTLAKKLEEAQKERTQRGKFFSVYASQQNMAGLGYSKPNTTTSFDMLRQAREKSIIDSTIINARVQQIKTVAKREIVPGKQLGFRVVNEQHANPNYQPTADVIRRCQEMERIIDNVDDTIHRNGFIDFAAAYTDIECTYDHNAMVITRDRQGFPIRYHLVDGSTIHPVIEVLMNYREKHKQVKTNQEAVERIYKEGGADLTNAAYVQVINGFAAASWTEDEMKIHITNPSVEINRWAYGAGSSLEKSLSATISWMNAWTYNDGMFNQDSPEAMLFLYGDVDPVGLGQFQRQILDQSGSGDYQKIPVIPADEGFKAELVKIRELPKDIQFAEFLRMVISLKTAAFRAHPSIVNFSVDKGAGSGMSIGANNEGDIIQAAKEEGFQSIVHGLAQFLTRTIVKPRYSDLMVIFTTDLEDERQRVELLAQQTKMSMTFNEARRAQGMEGDLPFGDVLDNANYIAAMQAGTAAQAQSASAKPVDVEGKQPAADGKDADGHIQDPNKVSGNLGKHLAREKKVLTITIED